MPITTQTHNTMPDIHWSELLIVGVIALVVLGPKDFAKGMRTLGKWTREARIAMHKTRAMLDAAAMEADILEERDKQLSKPTDEGADHGEASSTDAEEKV